MRIGLAVACAAQLVGVAAGEGRLRVELLALERAGVAAAETLQVGLPARLTVTSVRAEMKTVAAVRC